MKVKVSHSFVKGFILGVMVCFIPLVMLWCYVDRGYIAVGGEIVFMIAPIVLAAYYYWSNWKELQNLKKALRYAPIEIYTPPSHRHCQYTVIPNFSNLEETDKGYRAEYMDSYYRCRKDME